MFLPSPSGLGGSLLPVALVGIQARDFSLRNREAAAGRLLREGLVEISMGFLEAGRVKALREHRGIADDILTAFQLFGIRIKHVLLDFVTDRLGFGPGLFHQSLPAVQLLNLVQQFVVSHCFSFLSSFGFQGVVSPRMYMLHIVRVTRMSETVVSF